MLRVFDKPKCSVREVHHSDGRVYRYTEGPDGLVVEEAYRDIPVVHDAKTDGIPATPEVKMTSDEPGSPTEPGIYQQAEHTDPEKNAELADFLEEYIHLTMGR